MVVDNGLVIHYTLLGIEVWGQTAQWKVFGYGMTETISNLEFSRLQQKYKSLW